MAPRKTYLVEMVDWDPVCTGCEPKPGLRRTFWELLHSISYVRVLGAQELCSALVKADSGDASYIEDLGMVTDTVLEAIKKELRNRYNAALVARMNKEVK